MLWEMLYVFLFFMLPLVGIVSTVVFKKDIECQQEKYYGYEDDFEPCLVIDLACYRKLSDIMTIKKREYARDGPRKKIEDSS